MHLLPGPGEAAEVFDGLAERALRELDAQAEHERRQADDEADDQPTRFRSRAM